MFQNEMPIKKEIQDYICGISENGNLTETEYVHKKNFENETNSQNIALQSVIPIKEETQNYICGLLENETKYANFKFDCLVKMKPLMKIEDKKSITVIQVNIPEQFFPMNLCNYDLLDNQGPTDTIENNVMKT